MFESLFERGALFRISQEAPKCRECAAGFALRNHIDSGEQPFQNFAAISVVVQEPLPKLAVQTLEIVPNPAEISGETVGQSNCIANAFQCLRLAQRLNASALNFFDLPVQAFAFGKQSCDRDSGFVSVSSASLTSC